VTRKSRQLQRLLQGPKLEVRQASGFGGDGASASGQQVQSRKHHHHQLGEFRLKAVYPRSTGGGEDGAKKQVLLEAQACQSHLMTLRARGKSVAATLPELRTTWSKAPTAHALGRKRS